MANKVVFHSVGASWGNDKLTVDLELFQREEVWVRTKEVVLRLPEGRILKIDLAQNLSIVELKE